MKEWKSFWRPGTCFFISTPPNRATGRHRLRLVYKNCRSVSVVLPALYLHAYSTVQFGGYVVGNRWETVLVKNLCLTPNSWTKSIQKSFYFLAIHSHLYSFALSFLLLQTHATSYIFFFKLTQPPMLCYCTLHRRKEDNPIEFSRLCPETSMKSYFIN